MRKSGKPRALALAVPVRGFRGRDIRLFFILLRSLSGMG